MPTVDANGVELFYQVRGDGEPVLLIAGYGCDHTIWARVIPGLAAGHRVIAFDNRGVGRSSPAPAGIREMAGDAAALLDALGVSAAHVVGHSMGGLVAQELALTRPGRVRTLTLLSTCDRLDARGRAVIEAWGDLPFRVDVATAARLIVPWIYTSRFFEKPGAVAQVIDQIVSNPYPPTAEALYHQSRAVAGFDSSDRLHRIACPTLVAVGGEDILLPVPFSEQLARGIPGAELVVLPYTGHGLLIESPDAVTGAMLDFLSRRSP